MPAMETNGKFFADKLMDLANFGVTALVFGQLLAEQMKIFPLVLGFSLLIVLPVVSYFLRKKFK
ncbi:MAG: hypothetical protein HYU34_00185 [Candidatus Omnitrophica bacterium]|nr:hypothetical protein [Candidatus Omnitrophota bacterium]